jgi:predicted small lipoprotein YifL
MSKSIWLVISLLVASCLLSACGQKGALYLPDGTETETEQKKED